MADEYKRADGVRYTRFLDQLHAACLFDWYLEIGCRTGRSFMPVRSKTVAVDPFFKVEENVIGAKPVLHIFQQTSDAFFEMGFLKKMGIKLGFSFLDGMHLYEFLLRDFINTEANSLPGGVIAMHDLCPWNNEMTTRDLEHLPKGAWTGDVWKLIPILQKYRPDLKITVLDCKGTGLVLVSNLNPKNTDLKKNYEQILADWTDLDLETFGAAKYFDSFEYTNARTFRDTGFPLFSKVVASDDKAINPVWITP